MAPNWIVQPTWLWSIECLLDGPDGDVTDPEEYSLVHTTQEQTLLIVPPLDTLGPLVQSKTGKIILTDVEEVLL